MDEEIKLPTITSSDIPETTEPTSWTGSTAPVSEVVNTEPIPEPVVNQVVEAPVEAPIIEAPTPEPTVITPEVTVEPTVEQVKVEEKAPTIVEAPKQPTGKVETVQDINAKETSNKAAEEALNEQKKTQVVTEMQQMIQNGSTLEEIQKFGVKNAQFRDDINTVLRWSFKNTSNTAYFGKYSTLNNEDMLAAYNAWEVVPNSEQYNLLPPAQRARFDAFLSEQETVDVLDKTDFTSSSKVLDMTELESQAPKMFSSTVRENYQKALNDPRLAKLSTQLNQNEVKLDDIDDDMESLQDRIEKAAWPWALISQLNSRYKDEYKELTSKKRWLLRERKLALWEYQTLKGNAETELKISMYEDGLAKDEYDTQLALYESRRQEKRADIAADATTANKQEAAATKREQDIEDKIFEETNKILAADTQFQRDKSLLEFKAQLDDEWVTWKWEERDDGTYFERSDWTRTKVLDAVTTPWITENTVFENWQAYTEVYDINNNWVWFTSQNTSLEGKERELLNAPDNTRIPTRLNKDQLSPNNPWGKECGEYVNDIMARTVWSKIGSKWQDKLNYANESSGWVWSVAVWKINPNIEDKWGHTGVIVWETETDWVKEWIIKSSNVNWVWIVKRVRVPKDAINWYKSTWVIGKEKVFNEAQKELLDAMETKDLVTKENKLALAGAWLSFKDALDYKAENLTELKKDDYKSALNQIDKMMASWDGDWFSDAIWMFSWERDWSVFSAGARTEWGQPVFDKGTDSADFAANFTSLVDALTLPNLDKMSWVLTDKDIALLRNAATGWISMDMSEKEFLKSVDDLKWALNRAISWKKIPDGKIIFADDKGIQYSQETLSQYIVDKVTTWKWTLEESQEFIELNDLTDKL